MSGMLARVGCIAAMEWGLAVRSRRAMVMTLLFLAVAAGVMYLSISSFMVIEREVLSSLSLPTDGAPGSAMMTLWKSRPFVRFVEHVSGGSLVFADIKGRHPILLVYAVFLFQVVPLLTLLVSSSRVADDIRSGAARYWLVRVTRTEWSLGKFLGEALMLASAMVVGAFAAWGVVLARLPFADGLTMLPGLVDWTLRAWVYAFAWLGLFLGLSHLVKSGGKATALCILALLGTAVWDPMLRNLAENVTGFGWASHLDVLVPGSSWTLLWRRSLPAVLEGVVRLASLAFFYLALGAAVFRRRDI